MIATRATTRADLARLGLLAASFGGQTSSPKADSKAIEETNLVRATRARLHQLTLIPLPRLAPTPPPPIARPPKPYLQRPPRPV